MTNYKSKVVSEREEIMGTRSLLAFEQKNGSYYIQYMQFDGYPSVKGREFYEAVVTSLQECPSHFMKNEKPNMAFFKRIKDFLNNYQYASGHSIDNNWTCVANDWDGQDAMSAWKYLFDRDGNFHFFNTWHAERMECIIPWEFTRTLATAFNKGNLGFPYEESKLGLWWDSLDRWNGREDPPMISLESVQTHSFPGQGNDGWRNAARLRIYNFIGKDAEDTARLKKHAQKLIVTSFFKDKPKRKKKMHYPIFKSDYITVRDTKEKDLPLLVGKLIRKDAQHLLEHRLGVDSIPQCPDCLDFFPEAEMKEWDNDTSVCEDCYRTRQKK